MKRVESDFVSVGGNAPTFHVWTGSRYSFVGGKAVTAGQAPCNAEFSVEVSPDPAFASSQTMRSGWGAVDRDLSNLDGAECYGTRVPSDLEWRALQSAFAAPLRIY